MRIRDITYDWTITKKTAKDDQIQGFFNADAQPAGVVIIRPTDLGGAYLLPRATNARLKR